MINIKEALLALSLISTFLLVREFSPKLVFFTDFLYYTCIINLTGSQVDGDGQRRARGPDRGGNGREGARSVPF